MSMVIMILKLIISTNTYIDTGTDIDIITNGYVDTGDDTTMQW